MNPKKKVLIILQLCFAFAYLFWLGMQPFVRQVTATKASSLLLASVAKNPRFETLPENKQLALLKGQESLKKGTFRPLVTKYRFPLAGIVWTLLSIAICFFLLFSIEGAHSASWLLPLAVVAYACTLGRAPPLKGENIFPPESTIRERFITEEDSFKNKKEELIEGWNRYLITDWAHATPTEIPEERAELLDTAIFNFNVERATWVLEKRGEDAVVAHLLFTPSIIQILAYLVWNTLFAWKINRFKRLEARSQKSLNALA